MTTISTHIESIIIRQLDHLASAAELAELEAWLSEDGTHQEAYQALLRVWDESAAAVLPFQTAAAWEKVSGRIEQAKVVRLRNWKTAAAVAAALVLVAGLPALYFSGSSRSDTWQVVTAKGNQLVRLPDGTQVSLRTGSQLRYPEQFAATSREVVLEGEAYFEVQHEAGRPFRISTGRSVVTDLGTAFLLRTADSADQVAVTEGKVSLARKDQPRQQLVLLPGETGALTSAGLRKEATHTRNLLAWKEGSLRFEQTPLSEVTTDLGHYFGVRFRVAEGIQAENIRVTVQFRQQPLEEVLDELQLITGLTFTRQGSWVTVAP